MNEIVAASEGSVRAYVHTSVIFEDVVGVLDSDGGSQR
jgi:hypothetical protein